MTREEKLALIGDFESAYGLVEKMLTGLPGEALRFVPPIEGAWSVNDFLVHLLDADANLVFRVRGAVAEPGVVAPVWDEEAWHAKLRYGAEDGLSCIALASGLRSFIATGLRALVDEDWSGFWISHPARGRMELAGLLEMYRGHVAFHAPLIKRNIDAWKAR